MGGRGGKLYNRERRKYHIFGNMWEDEESDGTDDWFKQNSNTHSILDKNNKDDGFEAVYFYTGSGHRPLNKLLRGLEAFNEGSSSHQDLVRQSEAIEQKLNESTLNKPMQVLRGDSSVIFGKKFMTIEQLKQYEGGLIQDNGFTSASAAKDEAAFGGDVLYTIQVPKGRGIGAWVNHMSQHSGEREFLFNSGSTFRVRKVESYRGDTDRGYEHHVVLEYVGRYKLKSKNKVKEERGF